MGIVIRQSFRSTLITYIGAVLGAITVVWLFPKVLTPEQIGLTRLLLETAVIFAFFAQLGTANAVVRYFPYFKDASGRHQGIIGYAAIIPFIGLLFLTIFFFLFRPMISSYFGKQSSLFVNYLYLLLPLTFFNVYLSVTEALSSTFLRIVIPRLVREVGIRVMMIIITVALSVFGWDFTTYLYLYVGIYGLAMLVNTFYLLKQISRPFQWIMPSDISKNTWKEMGSFLVFMILAGLGSTLVTKIDVIMISGMLGLSFTGVYSIAFFMAAAIEMPARSIIQITSPILSEHIKKEEWTQVEKIYKQVTLNQFIIGGLLFMLIWMNADNFFAIIPKGHLYSQGKYVLLFIGLAKLFDVITGVNLSIIAYSRYFRFSLFLVVFLLVLTIASNSLFIPLWGITGAAIATALSVFLNNLAALIIVYKKSKIHPFTLNNLKTLFLLTACIVIGYVIPSFPNPWADLVIRSGIVSIVYIFFVLVFNLSDDISRSFQSIFRFSLR